MERSPHLLNTHHTPLRKCAAVFRFGLVAMAVPTVVGAQPRVDNPIQYDTITQVLNAILDVIVIFAVPIIIFFIVYAGFLYVTAQGNTETIKKAHRALLYALIGGVIILGAEALGAIIENTVNQISN